MSIKKKAINGSKWVTIATIITTVLQFIQVAILARLIDPTSFGIISISTLLINFFTVFYNLGFANSIIYKQENDRKVLSTIYILNIVLGVIIFLSIYCISPFVVNYYKEARLDEIIKLSAFYFPVVYVGQLYSFLLQKELKFKTLAIIDIVGALTGTIIALLFAYNHYEEKALIYGQISMQAIRSLLQILYGREFFSPVLNFNLKGIKDHLQFGIFNLGDGLVGFIQSNSDNILIGGMLGVKYLGYYTIAYQLAIFPINKLNPIILQVAYPLLAKIKESNADIKKAYLSILDVIMYLNMPLLAGLFITSDSVIPLLYGSGWEPTIPLIRIFIFISFFSCLSNPLFTIVFTKGKPKLLFLLNLATLIIKAPLLYYLGVHWHVTGIAYAFLIATAINTFIGFYIAQSLIGNYMNELLKNISKPFLFCLLMLTVIIAYQYFIGTIGILNTLIEILLGGIVYICLTLSFKVSQSEVKAIKNALL